MKFVRRSYFLRCSLVLGVVLFNQQASANRYTDIELTSTETGAALGKVRGGPIEIDYHDKIKLSLQPKMATDEMVLSVLTKGCQFDTQSITQPPFEFEISPNRPTTKCKINVTGLLNGDAVGQINSTISFTANTPIDPPDDPPIDDDPQADSGRINFTQGTANSAPYNVGAVVGGAAHGNRVYCMVSHFSYDDPIIYPGQPGKAHLHMFWGNHSTDAYSTPETMPLVGKGSCTGGAAYRAGVWMPALFNDADEVVVPDLIYMYYKWFGERKDLLRVVPQGIEMLASRDTLNYEPSMIDYFSVHKDGKPMLRVNLFFPSCVATEDGTRTGRPILSYKDMPGNASQVVNSHVAYPGGPNRNQVGCPASHPYAFPTPEAILHFDTLAVGSNPYVASDMMTGAPNMSTLHGDYIFGVDESVNQSILRCVQEGRNCGFDNSAIENEEMWYNEQGDQLYLWNILNSDPTPFGSTLKPMQ